SVLWTTRHDDETTCPVCGWEFIADSAGNVVDDGDLDREPLLGVSADGDLESVDLLTVTCQHCGRGFETEPGDVARCPNCRRKVNPPDGVPADENRLAYASHLVDHELDCDCDVCYGDSEDGWDESQCCPNCSYFSTDEEYRAVWEFTVLGDGLVR